MPKIVQQGQNKDKIIGLCICNGKNNGGLGCGATLEVYVSDLFKITHADREGGFLYGSAFECPNCGTLNDVDYNRSNLPERNELALYNIKDQCLEAMQQRCKNDIKEWELVYYLIRHG